MKAKKKKAGRKVWNMMEIERKKGLECSVNEEKYRKGEVKRR